jgi:glycosyltransferase involved in cell wall biosynthesis
VDYLEMAAAFDADLVDYTEATRSAGLVGRLVATVLGENARLALRCHQLRNRYDVIVTDGEQVGLPLAALLWISRRRRARHLMIVHIMSTTPKTRLFRALRLGSRIDEMLVYATAQADYITSRLRYQRERITLTPFMVDTAFFAPDAVVPSRSTPLVSSAGLELRDYPTLVEAVRGLDVDVVLAAASPWSKRRSELDDMALPDNIDVVRLDLAQLRQLYADSTIVVMPLRETDFQAGITTILEAMSMAKPLICTRTTGQTDAVDDQRTGVYVPVGDSVAWRAAITDLLADHERAAGLGSAARAWAVEQADIGQYAARLAARVDAHRRDR